jgi:uncharacterized SAM-binding protein YcdF (DUF218 family)
LRGKSIGPFLALFGFLLLVWLFRKNLLTAAGAALVEDDGTQKMQAAVVLGGDEGCERILKAGSLARAGYVPFVIVSGPAAFGIHECDLTISYAEQKGFPAEYFQPFPNDFTSTRDEADGIGQFLHSRGLRRVLLVTSNYHTRRAARLFRRENRDLDVRVVPAPDRSFSPDSWWQNREGRKTFLLEWTKTVAAWIGS